MQGNPDNRLKVLMFICLLMLGSLFALTGLRQFFVEPLASRSSNIIWFLLQIAPLAAVLPGMLRLKYRSYFLGILFVSLYFVHGVLLSSAGNLRTLGLWEVAFSLLFIFAATYVVKLTKPQ